MSEYIVVGFPGQLKASQVLKNLEESGGMDVNIEAVAVASRDDIGRVQVHSASDVSDSEAGTLAGAISGGVAGLLIGAITANPLVGIAGPTIGAMTGAILGDTADIGFDDEFTKEVGRLMDLDSSAICFLFWDALWDEIPAESTKIIQDAGGTVIRTTLSVADEDELKSKLGVE